MLDINEVINECQQVAEKAFRSEFNKMMDEGYKYNVVCNSKVVGQMYDVCGFAIVRFSDKRTALYKAYKKYRHSLGDKDNTFTSFYDYPTFGRQELRIHKAISYAVSNYLNSLGAKTYVVSWVD